MAILHTQINTRSPEFAANSAAMLEQVNNLRALLGRVSEGGGAAQQRHVSRGKLLVRERIDTLLDAGSAFSNSRRWPPMRSMAKTSLLPAWWPVSAASKASSA